MKIVIEKKSRYLLKSQNTQVSKNNKNLKICQWAYYAPSCLKENTKQTNKQIWGGKKIEKVSFWLEWVTASMTAYKMLSEAITEQCPGIITQAQACEF